MVHCSYCDGVSERRRSCQNCGAPLVEAVERSAIIYNPKYIDASAITGKPGEMIPVAQGYIGKLSDLMSEIAGAFPSFTGSFS